MREKYCSAEKRSRTSRIWGKPNRAIKLHLFFKFGCSVAVAAAARSYSYNNLREKNNAADHP